MRVEKILELLACERQCVTRNVFGDCDRKCEGCDLLAEAMNIIEMYENELKPVEVKIRCENKYGMWYVCGSCEESVSVGDRYCHECGRRLKWND